MRRRGAHATVALLYLATSLWCLRAVLPDPWRLLPYEGSSEGKPGSVLMRADQLFVAAQIFENARRLVTAPTTLYDNGMCYPVSTPVTLGEHMLADGILGVVPAALTRDPIFTYNVVLILTLWIAALAMYALTFYWTERIGPAFVAGALFGFQFQRVFDTSHPFVHGNVWTPLALLFAHRLFAHRRWRDALGLTFFVGMQVLESIYPIAALAAIGGVYGAWQLARGWRVVPSLLPKLIAVATALGALATLVYGPYVRTAATWQTLGSHPVFLRWPAQLGFGQRGYFGSIAIALATLGLWDRLRRARPRAGEDPRLAWVVAGLVVTWLGIRYVPLPFVTRPVPSLWTILHDLIPAFDVGRGFATVTMGGQLMTDALAAYGVLWLVERLPRLGGIVAPAILGAASLAEVLHPDLALASYGIPTTLLARNEAPDADLVALYARLGPGAVLDLPVQMLGESESVFLRAYHGRPSNGCCTSYWLPIGDDVRRIAAQVPAPGALDALYALGFRTLVVHAENQMPNAVSGFRARMMAAAAGDRHLVGLGRAGSHTLYRIDGRDPATAPLDVLEPARALLEPAIIRGPRAEIAFRFANPTPLLVRHPDPLAPTEVTVRWQAAADGAHVVQRVRMLLPVAVPPGTEAMRTVIVAVPPPGDYTLSLATAPGRVLAMERVRVEANGPR